MSLSQSIKMFLDLSGLDPKLLDLFSSSNDSNKFLIVDEFFKCHLAGLNIVGVTKNNENSDRIRKKGNELYIKFSYWEALKHYNESMAYALNNSAEMCLAYGNRASCLLRLNYIKEALQDIETALSICTCTSYKKKLFERQKYCKTKLNNNYASSNVSFGCGNIPQLSRKRNLFLDSTSEVVELAYDASWGKKLVVNNDVNVGEILIIEKPYSSLVLPEYFYSHCSNCFKRSLNLFPCTNCVTTMFCSQKCHKSANHAVECSYLNFLYKLKAGVKELLALKTLIIATKEGKKVEKLHQKITRAKNYNNKEFYSSNDFFNIFNLITNCDKRSAVDLFNRALVSVVLISILEKCTDFFKYAQNERRPILKEFCWSLIFRLLQSIPCNAHAVNEYSVGSEVVEIGAGAYAVLSLINHSCDPNVVRFSFRNYIVLKAIKPISKGSQLFDNYGYHYAVHVLEERQSALLEQYYFKCQCEACLCMWPTFIQSILKHDNIQSVKFRELNKQFEEDLQEVAKGNHSDEIVERNIQYLHYLHNNVNLPDVNYSRCQELIKECWNYCYNYFKS